MKPALNTLITELHRMEEVKQKKKRGRGGAYFFWLVSLVITYEVIPSGIRSHDLSLLQGRQPVFTVCLCMNACAHVCKRVYIKETQHSMYDAVIFQTFPKSSQTPFISSFWP